MPTSHDDYAGSASSDDATADAHLRHYAIISKRHAFIAARHSVSDDISLCAEAAAQRASPA